MSAHQHPHVVDTVVAGYPALHAVPPTGTAAPPIVFLHGAFTDQHSFGPWLPRFAAAGFACLAPARRGRQGVAPTGARGVRIADYVADTEAVLDELGASAVLVGHSVGALVAQVVAARRPVRALVLLAPAPPWALAAQPRSLRWLAGHLPAIASGRPFVLSERACAHLALGAVPSVLHRDVFEHLTAESGRVFAELIRGRIRVDPARVQAPVFVAGGDADRIVSTADVDRVAAHYRTHPHRYGDAGHWLLSGPVATQLAADVLDWLRAVTTLTIRQ